MGYGWISDAEIKLRATNNAYRKGSAYYKNGAVLSVARTAVVPYAGASKKYDCISVMIRAQDQAPKRKGSGKDGRYLVRVYAIGVTICDCQANPKYACRHTVAAMLHVMDNLDEIGAESPKELMPIRSKQGDECIIHDVGPDLFFKRRLIACRGDMKKALADLKFEITYLVTHMEYQRYERLLGRETTRHRDRGASNDRTDTTQLSSYVSYLQKLMIKYADTPQKKIKYVKYLADNLEETHEKFATKVFKGAMKDLARRGSEWRTYVKNASWREEYF